MADLSGPSPALWSQAGVAAPIFYGWPPKGQPYLGLAEESAFPSSTTGIP